MNFGTDRFLRQKSLVPADALSNLMASVIGVGAIGRQIALQLAAIGVPQIQLIDFDTVELTNVTTQGYWHDDVGQSKVTAAAAVIHRIDPQIVVETIIDRYRPRITLGSAVFSCVDLIETRAAIWRTAANRCRFWCDSRMLGEVLRILTAADPDSRQYYATTLFSGADAQRGSCTAHSTIYVASIAAGYMLHQLSRWLRGFRIDRDISVNLLASELSVA